MQQRGRPSAAALMSRAHTLEIMPRQQPPHDLHDEEVEIWQAVVSTEPPDWFSPSSAPLLTQYCRHIVHARRIAEIIERKIDNISVYEYKDLLQMQARESSSIANLATKMRLSQSATINKRLNKINAITVKPWERAESE